MATDRRRADGPALFSYGFRPFFLAGSLFAIVAIGLWIPMFDGHLELPATFIPRDWHIHEMLFGYLGAVLGGFLLTAIPNWTGRLPTRGWPLAALAGLWLVGRVAVGFSSVIGPVPAAIADCAYLAALLGLALMEIVSGRNWRNLLVLAPVSIFLLANIGFHYEAAAYGASDVSYRAGLGAAIVLIVIVGGRIIPSFTRNWLAKQAPGRMPAPFARFDAVVIALTALSLAAWAFAPEALTTGAVLLLAGGANLLRLARWAGERVSRERLVLILHLAYVFAPLGLIAAGLAVFAPDAAPAQVGVHLLAIGAIGGMTLAVMTRATLGHTGRDLHASATTQGIYAAVLLAAAARAAWAFAPETRLLLHASAGLWMLAFLGFALKFGPMLVRPDPRLLARKGKA